MPTWFMEFVKFYGAPFGLVLFFIYRDWCREKSMTDTIAGLRNQLIERTTGLEKEMREILKELVIKCTTALVDNANAMREVTQVIAKCKGKD